MIFNKTGMSNSNALSKQILISETLNIETNQLVIPISFPANEMKGFTIRADFDHGIWASEQPEGYKSYKAGAVDFIVCHNINNSDRHLYFVGLGRSLSRKIGFASTAFIVDNITGTLTLNFANASIKNSQPDGFYLVDGSYTLVVWW